MYKSSQSKDLSWKWNAAYNIARRMKYADSETKNILSEIQKILFVEVNENHLRFDALVQAIKWAELDHRTSKNNS